MNHNYIIKISDFGLAGLIKPNMDPIFGSPGYMAPELHTGGQYDGEKIDLFATAVILFLMISGNPPFNSAQLSDPFFNLLATG